MTQQALIVGGGIGGLAAATACARAGWLVRLYEKAPQFSEVGAGIQLGPNATRILSRWGLAQQLADAAAFPQRLVVRSARDGAQLGELPLGGAMTQRYGAPYATVHRADLQGLLLDAARNAGAQLALASSAAAVTPSATAVGLRLANGQHDGLEVEGDALIAADGLWGAVRSQVHDDGPALFTGHLAWRALVAQHELPQSLRSQDVNVWLGPRMHLVAYPVRRGEQLNVVVLTEGPVPVAAQEWDHAAVASQLHTAIGPVCTPLRDLVHAMPQWRLWALHDRAPVSGHHEMARGRVALLGDAAHPMRPYFAQGAGMAIEDAAELARALSIDGLDVPLALRRYALARWQRVAKVQSLSRRNGRIFHSSGIVRWGRDVSMRILGKRLLDQPWLYREG